MEMLKVASSRGRGRPRKRATTVVSMATKQQQPIKRVIMVQSGSSNSHGVAQHDEGSNIRLPAVLGKTTPTALGKTSVLLDKRSPVVVGRTPTVSVTRPVSTASRLVVINTNNTAAVKAHTSQTQTVSSNTVMKSALSHSGAAAERVNLLAGNSSAAAERVNLLAGNSSAAAERVNLLAGNSSAGAERVNLLAGNSSSKTATSATVVIIRSSSSSSSLNTPAAATLVKNSSGSVVMSVKKVSSVLPLTYRPGVPPAQAKLAQTKLSQAKLAPVIKVPPFRHTTAQGSAVAVVSQKMGSTLLHDGWKLSTTNTSYQAPHTKRFVASVTS